jgi:hypothetical protein
MKAQEADVLLPADLAKVDVIACSGCDSGGFCSLRSRAVYQTAIVWPKGLRLAKMRRVRESGREDADPTEWLSQLQQLPQAG